MIAFAELFCEKYFMPSSTNSRLRGAALIVLVIGAAVSMGLMLHAGRRNDSRLLLVLMAIWVLSPFIVLALAEVVSKSWSAFTRAALHSVMLVVTLGSLVVYGHDALRPRAKAAFVYVVVPPASWVLMAIVLPVAALISGRRARGIEQQGN